MIRKNFENEIKSNIINNKNNRVNDIAKRIDKLIYDSPHYSGEIETIDFIRDKLTEEEFIGYCKGNAIKYLSRIKHKESIQDAINDYRKAFTYTLIVTEILNDKFEEELAEEAEGKRKVNF